MAFEALAARGAIASRIRVRKVLLLVQLEERAQRVLSETQTSRLAEARQYHIWTWGSIEEMEESKSQTSFVSELKEFVQISSLRPARVYVISALPLGFFRGFFEAYGLARNPK